MVKLCAMASQGYLPALVFHPEQGFTRISKDFQPLLPSPESRPDVIRSGSLTMRPHQSDLPWRPTSGLLDANQLVRLNSTIRRPVLINVQETRSNSVLFSYGIANQCTRREDILKFLMSGTSELERGGLDLSILSDLMGLQPMTLDMPRQPYAPDYGFCFLDAELQPTLFYPSREFYSQKPILDFAGDLARRSKVAVHLDGPMSIMGDGTDMKDILSVIAEFYFSKNSTTWRKQSILVPYFNRLNRSGAGLHAQGSLKLEAMKCAPLKSPEKIKLKQSPKKKNNRRPCKERDLYKKNYFHSCESLLSILVDKKRNGRTAILELKKSGPELPQILTQFSASIAGMGLALLFSVVFKVASGRVPFCASKLLNTGLGLGLVWLSWAVNRLRDTVLNISKKPGKLGMNEEEIMKNLDRSVKEIYFRAATLMAVVVLRLA